MKDKHSWLNYLHTETIAHVDSTIVQNYDKCYKILSTNI